MRVTLTEVRHARSQPCVPSYRLTTEIYPLLLQQRRLKHYITIQYEEVHRSMFFSPLTCTKQNLCAEVSTFLRKLSLLLVVGSICCSPDPPRSQTLRAAVVSSCKQFASTLQLHLLHLNLFHFQNSFLRARLKMLNLTFLPVLVKKCMCGSASLSRRYFWCADLFKRSSQKDKYFMVPAHRARESFFDLHYWKSNMLRTDQQTKQRTCNRHLYRFPIRSINHLTAPIITNCAIVYTFQGNVLQLEEVHSWKQLELLTYKQPSELRLLRFRLKLNLKLTLMTLNQKHSWWFGHHDDQNASGVFKCGRDLLDNPTFGTPPAFNELSIVSCISNVCSGTRCWNHMADFTLCCCCSECEAFTLWST